MSTEKTLSYTDKALAKIADLIVQRMEELKGEQWQKPWFSSTYQGTPQNITGRPYNGMNELVLDFVTATKGHELPVFLTFNQATKEGIHVNKGAVSIPVLYYERSYKDDKGKIFSESQVKSISKEELSHLTPRTVLKKFDVFNIEDSNFKEVKPEKYAALKQHFDVQEVKDTQGMYQNSELDRMFKKNEWLCPIEIKESKSAYYVPSSDSITLPLKGQFKTGATPEAIYRDGMEFYSTAIHEMAHSTGSPDRLNREKGSSFGDKAYAKEELIAELTAALVGRSLGFDRQVSDNSAKYLNNWVGALKSDPRFVLTILSEVNKASAVIMGEIEKQKISLKNELPEKQGKSRSIYELMTQYNRINEQYPTVSNSDSAKHLISRIDLANRIISSYDENIAKYYGTDWLRNPKNAHHPIPQNIYTGRFTQSEHVIGTITWTVSGETATMYFSDKENYLSTLQKEFTQNPSGISFKTLTRDASIRKAVDDIIYNFADMENPHQLKDYESSPEVTNASLVKMRSGEYAIRGRVDGEDTGLLTISKEEAVSYLTTSPSNQKSFLHDLIIKNFPSPSQANSQHTKTIIPKV